jgi:hypothetical protein
MSTIQAYTTVTRPSASASNVGLTIFNTTTNQINVSDGANWRVYDSTLDNLLAADFTGTDDYLDCGSDNGLNLTSAFTYSLWVNPSNTTTWHGFFTRRSTVDNSGIMLFAANNPDMVFFAGSSYTFTDIDLVAGEWQHYAFTFDGTTLRGYRNGVVSTNTFTPTIPSVTSNVDFIIGKHHTNTNSFHYQGLMDELAVWSSALSASEVNVLASGPQYLLGDNAGYNSSSDLVAWWRMGDGSGDTDSGSGTPANGDTIGTVKNLANPGTHDGSAVNSPTYTNNAPK